MISPLVSASLRGASITSSTGTSRRPLGPTIDALAPAAISAGHAVGGRRAVAQVAAHGGAALDLGRADQVGGLDDAGPDRLELGVLLELGAGDGGADAEAARLLLDLARLGDALDVDHEHGVEHVGAHLHQQIGAAGQHTRIASFLGEQRDRLVERIGRLIAHVVFLLTGCVAVGWHTTSPRANPWLASSTGTRRFCIRTMR